MKTIVNPWLFNSVAPSVLAAMLVFVFFGISLAQTDKWRGVKFNGKNYLDCGSSQDGLFDFTGEGTIEAWVKVKTTPPPANSTTFFPIAAKDEGPGENNKWMFGIQNGKLVFHTNSPGENRDAAFSRFFTIYSLPFELTLNKYYHFAITKDKSNMITFYVNGINTGSSRLLSKTTMLDAPLIIGAAEPGFFMKGEIYEVRFWKKALSGDEIRKWMLKRIGRLHPDYASFIESFRLNDAKAGNITGQNGVVARLKNGTSPLTNGIFLPGWLIVAILATLVVIILCLRIFSMRKKMVQEKLDMELFTAQMSHENNNGIGMMINILSSHLNENGLGHLVVQLKQRLQMIADLQSAEYIIPGEKEIAFKKYIADLIEKMNSAFNQGKQIAYGMDLPEHLKAKYAMKLAILIRELTLNSLKHAFSGKTKGEITISIKPTGKGFFKFEFCDNGTGIVEQKKSSLSVGTTLINSLSSQLGGKPEIASVNGYKFVLLFRQ